LKKGSRYCKTASTSHATEEVAVRYHDCSLGLCAMGLQGDQGGLKGEADPAAHDCHYDCNYSGMGVVAK
jgi:hypothetical protein